MMNIPNELHYSKSHEWIRDTADGVEIGISAHAVEALGDLVFVNLPEEGDAVTAGEAFGDVESVKAVSDVYCPVSGVVAEVNTALLDAPELVNEDPYGAWFIRVSDVTEQEALLSADEYAAFLETEG